ncbi:PTS sugar transporter subunit IIC [Anaerococcus sp. AGMB00486]|uniref:Permease IIC component n=1 Tax=Anaerococcus faecalis TaxID=2742993 RepID=A0ABX2NCR3_9FIRM|nr:MULTISPECIES: PTS transporter subunit EIIC [Anaerococcus]MDY3005741.1 PTS transporter subunit EIIC [Anaerococcus porci]NVF12517.1 PTS sugar transporter subunit IIC [Anaerococcus faecalis]
MNRFNKFVEFLEKKLLPIVEKMEGQVHLQAIKNSMLALLPVTIIGSFTLVAVNLAQVFQNTFYANFVSSYELEIMTLFNFSMGLMGLFTALFVSYNLSRSYDMYTIGDCLNGLVMYLILNSSVTESGIDMTYLDSKGMFTGIFVAIISVEISRKLKEKNFIIKMPEGVPDMVSKNFELIIPLIVNSLVFLSIRILIFKLTGSLVPEIILSIMKPLSIGLNNVFGVMLLVFLIQLLWWFGIHGDATLGPIFLPVALQNITENAAAYAQGKPIPHVFTETFLSNFLLMSGSGITVGLLILMLFSKSKRYKELGKISLLPAVFGINEPITFGTPIVYNPILFIPYVIGPTLITLPIYKIFESGIVERAFIQSPGYTPFFLQGYLMNLSFKSTILQILILILSVLIYYPFFKVMEKDELKNEVDIKDSDGDK